MLRSTILFAAACSCLGSTASAQLSDYVVSSLQCTAADYSAGAPLRVTFVIKNDSAVLETRGSRASLRLSSDVVFSGDDVKLADVVVPALKAGDSRQFVVDLRVPWSLSAGKASLVLRADVENAIPEAIEINNDKALTKDARAWFGTPRIEYRPVLEQPGGLDAASVSTRDGGQLRMSLVAPDKKNHWYLLRMSASRNFQIDSWTVFGLELLNSAFQPRWFGQMQLATAQPGYWMPRGVPFDGSLQLYVSAVFVDPSFQSFTGDTVNSVGLRIGR